MTLHRITTWQALSQLPGAATARYPQGAPFAQMLRHGSMSVELYRPQGQDLQTPHAQDELYVVVAGRGEFFCGGDTQEFGPGDCLFVPAGLEHRFTRFDEDFITWVIFYGPQGGEANTSSLTNSSST
jgi:mannose-6-phosphate isomerase-like protein (cupin superfamily)